MESIISKSEREQIIALMKREVVPAIGCTEPIAVALCTAKATEVLGCTPEHINVYLSANILKNAMGVGIPGTGMIGLPIAIALGALIGKSEYGLEVLKDCTPEVVEKGKEMIARPQCINIALKDDIEEKLYIEVTCTNGNNVATAIISGGHTNFVYLCRNGEVQLDKRTGTTSAEDEETVDLTLRKVFDFATTAPIDEIRFILEAKNLNKAAAEQSLKGCYGHGLGRMLCTNKNEEKIMGNNTFTHILSYTSAACDARMAGAMIPVMSNSGSGNQGISATLPVVIFAEDTHATEEQLIRALTLSHLTAIYIKQSLGKLSALCGCVVAAQLCPESNQRRIYCRDVCHYGYGPEVRHCRRGHHRREREPEHPQPDPHRFERHERDRQDGARHHDPQTPRLILTHHKGHRGPQSHFIYFLCDTLCPL